MTIFATRKAAVLTSARGSARTSPSTHSSRTSGIRLTAAGLPLDCQVGCSGYWIDFAAKDPPQPGRYVLAIEADGVRYHSSETARDRDRLRQDHLERLGWRFAASGRLPGSITVSERSKECHRFQRGTARGSMSPAPEPMLFRCESQHEPIGNSCARSETLAKPWRPDGRQITEYPDFELVKFMRWIMSDQVPRTTEELVAIGTTELGYKSRGHRIVAALEQAIATVRAQDEKAHRRS